MNEIDPSTRRLYNVSSRQRYLLFENKQYLNFSSNDYLALSDIDLQGEFLKKTAPFDNFVMSNPSSRLMTGNSICYEELEDAIARLYNKESALVLSCGFMANSSLLPALVERGDLIIADKLVHASVVDGIRLANCDFERFKHNDMQSLRRILERKRADYNRVYVAVESIYSMDGDIAPLEEIVKLKKEFDLQLYVDEAHAFGVRGSDGAGVCSELGITDDIDIIVVTLGKALASQGGVVVSSLEVRERLINNMRSLIFSTALPDISLMWAKYLVDRLGELNHLRNHLRALTARLCDNLKINHSPSHIIPIVLGSNEAVHKAQLRLREMGYWVTAIRHPTVQKGGERLRISLSAGVTMEEIDNFSAALLSLYQKNE